MDVKLCCQNPKCRVKIENRKILRIRKIEEDRDFSIPIIAFTANFYSDDKEISIEVGMNAYLSKPFQSKTLFGLMQEYI